MIFIGVGVALNARSICCSAVNRGEARDQASPRITLSNLAGEQ